MRQQLETKLFAHCTVVDCSGKWPIDHIEPGHEHPLIWGCDVCGTPHRLRRLDATHAEVNVDPDRPMRRKKLLCLEMVPQTEPIRLVVRTEWTDGHDHQAYYYEEHTCPINWIRDVVGIAVGSDTDPHGFVRYVGMVDDLGPNAEGDKQVDAFLLVEGT